MEYSNDFYLLAFGQRDSRLYHERLVDGTLHLTGEQLRIDYRLHPTAQPVRWPEPSLSPSRLDGLWQHTCFELFIAPNASSQYLEFNFSPSGDWNCYAFDAYREGATQAVELDTLEVLAHSPTLRAQFCLPAGLKAYPVAQWQIGITAVIEYASGDLDYAALRHTAAKPDFHRRDSFCLDLSRLTP